MISHPLLFPEDNNNFCLHVKEDCWPLAMLSDIFFQTDPFSGNSQDWVRLIGIPFSFTFELRDKGEFAFELPEDQIQPVCEEVYVGVYQIIRYIHNITFHNVVDSGAASYSLMFWIVVMVPASLWLH